MSASGQLSWEEAVQWLKSQPEHSELVRSCFYDDPLLDASKRFHRGTEWRAVQKLLGTARGRALDVGAGLGISSFALAQDGWTTVALEPDASDVVGAGAIRRLASEAGLQIEVVETWGESLPFAANSFDLVYVRQVLHHARDLAQLCREIGRVLKPGGMMIAAREHVLSCHEDLESFLRNHPLHSLYGGEHAYLLEEYLGAMDAADIEVVRVLNPLASDINLYPETSTSVKLRMARKLHLPSPMLIADVVLSLRGKFTSEPGRLYTFAGRKRHASKND